MFSRSKLTESEVEQHHAVKLISKAVKKSKTFELQKLTRKVKTTKYVLSLVVQQDEADPRLFRAGSRKMELLSMLLPLPIWKLNYKL